MNKSTEKLEKIQMDELSPLVLSPVELNELKSNETIIERGLKVFYEVGQALTVIRDKRLYRATHATFDDYCRERWGMSKTHANRLIDTTDVIANLTPIGVILPANEAQARPLTVLPVTEQIEVWQEIVASVNGGKVTAKIVQDTVNRVRALTEALNNVSIEVRQDCIRLGISDPQLIKLLDEKKSTETYNEFVASGYIQLTGEDDAIKACDATAWDFQGWLREKSREYSRAAIERRQDAKLAAIQNQPQNVYSILYVDPPWEYENSGLYGAADRHYPTMPTHEICELPRTINLQIADSAILFLWATNPLLIDALEVIDAWGFQYKTNIVWDKEKPTTGLGFYVRGQHELLLIAVKGEDSWTPKERPASVLRTTKEGHSAKPDCLYSLIENMYPGQHYIELFARHNGIRPSWSYWGNQSQNG